MSLEECTRATQAKNLEWGPEVRQIDWVAAAGTVRDPLASAVARLMAGDVYAYWDVVGTLEGQFRRGITSADRKAIKDAVWHFIAPACETCNGRGHPINEDTPTLKDENCPDCHGTGKERHKNNTRVYADALMRLDGAAAICVYAIAEKVA